MLKAVTARYVLGLTATPVRRDSQQSVMFMLWGPVRHAARLPLNALHSLEVFPQRLTSSVDVAADAPIQTVFAHLAQAPPRTDMIAAAIREQFGQGRKVLVLTERTDHLDSLQKTWGDTVQPLFVLHGRLAKKARAAQLAALDALADDAPASYWPLANSLVRDLTTRRWICWCSLCPWHGKAPCTSMWADSIASMRAKLASG